MGLILGQSLPDTLLKRVQASPQKTALLRKKMGAWASVSWAEVEDRVFEIAYCLQASGVKRGDRVALLAQTRPEWFFCDLGIMAAGAATVPIYSAASPDDVYYILNDADVRFIFVEDAVQRQKVQNVLLQLKRNVQIVSFDRPSDDNAFGLESWVQKHFPNDGVKRKSAREEWVFSIKNIPASDLCSIVYTSGTLGNPKGVELSHQNFLSILSGVAQTMELSDRDLSLFFLPAAHIMGRVEQMMTLAVGLTTAYAESLGALIDNLSEIKPTLLVSVPRIYEKIHSSIQNRFYSESLVVREGFKLALETGRQYSHQLQQGKMPDSFLKLKYMAADHMYFDKVREKLGGRLRYCICGGASLATEIAEFFHATGILVLEGYGLTETTGPACLNRPNDFRFGSVGKPLPQCELQLAPDGEIMLKGPMVSRGYHNLPKETAESFKGDWFYSGDIGRLDTNGFLTIIDRKKDIIVTSGGKNIAPQKIENLFKSDSLISHIVVVGDNRHFLSALITLDKSESKRLAESLGVSSTQVGDMKADRLDQWLANEAFYREVEKRIHLLNERLPPHEQIKKFRVLTRDLSIEGGELTPSLKVRRAFCTEKYTNLIEQMYAVSPAEMT